MKFALQGLKYSLSVLVLTFVIYSGAILYDPLSGNLHALSLRIEDTMETISPAALFVAATNPHLVYVSVPAGLRKEEVAKIYQDKLGWPDSEVESFDEELICTDNPIEGYLFPGAYSVADTSLSGDIKREMKNRFVYKLSQTTAGKLTDSKSNTDEMLAIASMIQREAAGASDMRIVSGIIWNRIFKDMKLELDATLQYAKGEEGNWWPRVKSSDKYIDSPYNTYANKGLPPAPIANPGIAAISAALNPEKTNCLYYIHDKYGRIHCATTNAGHEQNIDMYLR